VTEEVNLSDDSALALRRPDVPIDLNELAARKLGEAIEILEARSGAITAIRKFAIAMTYPSDWTLFKGPAGTTAYLADVGCERIRALSGIEVFDVGDPMKVETNDPAIYQYRIVGSGRCNLTRQTIESIEGCRSSTDEIHKGKPPLEVDHAVRRASRANLDGNVVRELAGLNSVPIEELQTIWAGTPKSTDRCNLGRGFGSRDARQGGDVALDAGIDPPVCRICSTKMQLRRGQKGPFYSCPNYKDHGKDSYTIDAEKWIAEQKAKAPASPTPTAATTPPNGAADRPAPAGKVTPLSADDIPAFGNKQKAREREVGEEG